MSFFIAAASALTLPYTAPVALAAATSADEQRSRLISLASITLDVTALPEVPEALRAGHEGYFLVKYPGPVTATQHQALERAVERTTRNLYDTFLVKAGTEFQKTALQASGAAWVGPYHPAYKIAPTVASAGSTPGSRIVMLLVYPDANLAAVRSSVAALGVKQIAGTQQNPFFNRMRLLLDENEIAAQREALARIPDVFWIGLEGRKALLNDTTIWSHNPA